MINIGALPMYRSMSSAELLAYCRDDASKWAAAFMRLWPRGHHYASDVAIDEATMMAWFANAIEGACDHRARKAKPGRVTLWKRLDHNTRSWVADIDMPLQDLPFAIYWGSRFFVRHEGSYFEADVFTAPETRSEEWR